ncbi:MBL fold metallo-hydrolase [Murinocardiopsis flavida]|uniref:MBL fold metallo-hydrolase n=1 Tax=Murinocardiopsis flavida TaxID=645275 RepID=UPI000D0DE1A5|nr:MBL fold metallo-hydrolase [Murinocardiopsis flavida]
MRITKLGHACVRLEQDGATLVIDPGGFTEPGAAEGADAVAVTHEHADHLDLDQLRAAARANPDLAVYTNADIAARLAATDDLGARIVTVAHGDTPRIAGFDVHVYGARHAVIHDDIPVIANVGFRVVGTDGALFHPGDALTVPEDPVDTLLLPVQAPWSKIAEVADYTRAVRPRSTIAIHDALLSELGAGVYQRNLNALLPDSGYERLHPGQSREF